MGWRGWKAGQPRIGGLLVLPRGLPLDSLPAGRGRRPFWWLWTESAQRAVPAEGLVGGHSLLFLLEGIVVDGSLGDWRRLSGGFWIFRLGVTLQMDMGLRHCACLSLTCLSERLPLGSFSGSSCTICLPQTMGLTVSGVINLSFSLPFFRPSLSFYPPSCLGPSLSASLLGKLQVLWAEELESRVGEGGEAQGVSEWDLGRPMLS